MTARPRLLVLGALSLALATATVPLTGAAGADRPDPSTLARRHLSGDASGSVQVVGDRSGRVGFVGTKAGVEIDNPAVPQGASVARAARAHLDRYGALLGATGDTTYVQRSSRRSRSGTDVVTYTQEVGGVPVLGGDVVVSMGPDRGLRSVQSTVSGVGSVQAATVAEAQAAATARALVVRDTRASGLHVTAAGRWLLDPQVLDVPLRSGARTVWRFEVGDGAAVRQQVLVDDHTGQVLLHHDLIERADPDRVVCDRSEAPGADTSCVDGFARTEAGPASTVTDVNSAYDLSGVVSNFYRDVAGVSLTQLLGVQTSTGTKLASTVRFCPTASDCPYANAFWNGQQMFYGTGWASADDVVGHEMTHGFIDQYSQLFYWGQSGAINESMADVIGEIIDHRNPSPGDSASDWRLGEDSPVRTIRDLQNPLLYGQPDRMTSADYTSDADNTDSGGVHTNSGVGNKTAYLISQGGSFNGQTITGIDAGDPTLAKTAALYVDVIERLPSGADYAALAAQLDQSCQDLVAAGSAGFGAADCTAVHQAGLATELTSAPANVPTVAPADTTCPSGSAKRVLFDSEAGDPATAFTATTGAPNGWRRGSGAFTNDTWFTDDPATASANSLRLSSAVALPAGQQSYLSFRGWWVLDFDGPTYAATYYDGGTVELGVDGGTPLPLTSGWTNGPDKALISPNAGRTAFSGDSQGWVQSRADLSSYAGRTVRPVFTLRTDDVIGLYGWALDDIQIYTCDGSALPPPPPPPPPPAPPVPSAPQSLGARGGLDAMTVSWSAPAANPAAVTAYRVSLGGVDVSTVPASTTSVTLGALPSSSVFAVTVWAVGPPGSAVAGASVTVPRGYASVRARRHGARLAVSGSVAAGGAAVGGGLVQLQRRTRSGWLTVRTATTRSDGHFVTTVRRRHRASYRVVFLGSPGVVGTASARHRW